MPDHDYITLQEASKSTPFDSNYLGLLVRKGWLFGVKKKSRWYTTQEAVDQYMNNPARVKVLKKETTIHIGLVAFLCAVSLLLGALMNTFFFEEAVVAKIPPQQSWSADGQTSAVVSEGIEVSSSIARREIKK